MTEIQHRSYSQVKTLRTCGWQYKLKYIDGLPKRPNVTAVAGTVIHTVTELIDTEIHKGSADATALESLALSTATEVLDKEIENSSEHYPPEEWIRYGRATKEWPNKQDVEWFRQVGIPNSIRAYINFRLIEHPELQVYDLPEFGPAIEVPFTLYLDAEPVIGMYGYVTVIGYIDRIMVTEDGQLYLLDIKSGRRPESDEQLAPYRQALLDGAGIDVQYGGFVYALKTGEARLTPPIDLSHWTEQKLSTLYCTADYQIHRGIFIPSPGEHCMHCPVSQHCEYHQSVL